MKKIIVTLAVIFGLIGSQAYALTPYANYYMRVNPAGTGPLTSFSDIITGGVPQFFTIDPSTNILKYMGFGTRFSWNGGTTKVEFDLTAQPESNITNLVSDLSTLTSAVAAKFTLPGGGTTSQYLDGTGATQTFPSIPTAQVQTDWNAVSGLGVLLNKPTLGTAAAQNTSFFATAAQGALAVSATQPGANISTLTNDSAFIALSGAPVQSVAGKTGTVTLVKGDVGLGNVDNTSDANKPVSTAQAAAIALKYTIPTGTTAQYVRGDGTLATLPSPGSGTVTSVVCGTGLSGGTITTTGTCSMPNTGTSGTYSGMTTDAQGRVTGGTNRSWNNAPGRSLVTGTGATGFQVSSTRDSSISYAVKVSTTATIGTPSAGDIVLEIASTNSATPSDWLQIGAICGNSQNITLAALLSSVQATSCSVGATLPAGWYAKLRSVTSSGSPTYTYLSGQEMLF